jgi:mannosyltransferase
VAAPLLVLPAFLLLAESVVGPPLYVDRYVLYGEAGAALLAGAGVYRAGQWLADRAGPRQLLAVPGVVLCALALVLQLAPQHRIRTPQSRAYDFGGPSRYLAAHADSGDGVLFFGTLFRKAELGYPGDFTKVTDFGQAQSPTQAGTFRGTDKPFSQTYPLMLRYGRIWVIGLRPSPQLPAGLLRQESDALISHFSLVRTLHFKGMFVTLWQRR